MSDTLEIFGVEYTGVTGIVATDDNDTDLTYIRPQGTKPITANGTGIDVAEYASVNVSVSAPSPTLQTKSKSYTPSETAQSEDVTADNGYDGLAKVSVSVGAISSSYVGSGITRRDSTSLSASGDTVTAPAGYYANSASASVASGTIGTPTVDITKTSLDYDIDVSFPITPGYINTSPSTTVSLDIEDKSVTPSTNQQVITPTDTNCYLNSVTVAAMPSGSITAPSTVTGNDASISTDSNNGLIILTEYGVSNTPIVSTAGYVSSVSAKTSTIQLKAECDICDSSDLTASGATVTAPAGYYLSAATKTIASGTAGTPTATKGTVSNHSVSVTPSVTNTTGYITGSTKTGTAVTVTAAELASGNKEITENGTNIDVVGYSTVSVNVSGGGGMSVATATATPSTAGASIQFTGLSGEPTSFYVTSAANLATGAAPYKVAAVVFDGTNVIGQYITNTNNAQMTYSSSAFSKSYSNGTLTITASGANFQANQYKLVYTVGGTSANIGTEDVQVGSGVTSITFTGLTDEPNCFSCMFTNNIGTSSGYTRAHMVVFDGSSIYGMEMGSGSTASSNWTKSYSNGSLTITSTSTTAGGYFHQPGYYQLTYGIGGTVDIEIEPLSVTENGTYAESGKAYSPVVVNVSGGGSVTVKTTTMSNTSATATQIQFTSLTGQPKAFFCRCTSNLSRNSSNRYYYIADIRWDGSSTGGVVGNKYYVYNGQYSNQTTGYSQSYSSGTLTLTTTGSQTASPGSFYNGTYELVYVY